MFKQVKFTIAAALITLSGVSAQAHAADSGLERLVEGAVKHAVFATAQELNFDVLTAVANMTHQVSYEQDTFNTKVLISNVDTAQSAETANDDKAE